MCVLLVKKQQLSFGCSVLCGDTVHIISYEIRNTALILKRRFFSSNCITQSSQNIVFTKKFLCDVVESAAAVCPEERANSSSTIHQSKCRALAKKSKLRKIFCETTFFFFRLLRWFAHMWILPERSNKLKKETGTAAMYRKNM